MATPTDPDLVAPTRHWWVMQSSPNYLKLRDLLQEYQREHEDVFEVFMPTTFVIEKGAKGTKRRVERPLMFNYVFLRCTFQDMLTFYLQNSSLIHPVWLRKSEDSILTKEQLLDFETTARHHSDAYMKVSDRQMDMFIRTTEAYEGQRVPFLRPEEVDLENGDLVRIIGGPFDGVEGILQTQQGKDGGRVVVSIDKVASVPTLEIAPEFLEILAFAKKGKHLYKKFDSFIKKVRPALKNLLRRKTAHIGEERLFSSRKTDYDSEMRVFIRRFGNFQATTLYQECKKLTYLMMAHKVLSHDAEVSDYAQRAAAILPQLTSPNARRFLLVYLYACTGDPEVYKQAKETIGKVKPAKDSKKKEKAEKTEKTENPGKSSLSEKSDNTSEILVEDLKYFHTFYTH